MNVLQQFASPDADLTTLYIILVWAAEILCVMWMVVLAKDPANLHVTQWHLMLRRLGVLFIGVGLLCTVLFAGNQNWAPWPPTLIFVAGLDLYLLASILSAYKRMKVCGVCPFIDKRPSPA